MSSMAAPVVSLSAPGVVIPTALGGTVPMISASGPGKWYSFSNVQYGSPSCEPASPWCGDTYSSWWDCAYDISF